MGGSISTTNHRDDDHHLINNDQWSTIENENFILTQPNLLVQLLIQSDRDYSINCENLTYKINNLDKIDENIENMDAINPIESATESVIENRNGSASTSGNCSMIIVENDQIDNSNAIQIETKEQSNSIKEESSSCVARLTARKKEQTLEEFKEALNAKRMERQGAVTDLRNRIIDLRRQLMEEREINRKLRKNNVHVINDQTQTDVNQVNTATNTEYDIDQDYASHNNNINNNNFVPMFVPRVVSEIDYDDDEDHDHDENIHIDNDLVNNSVEDNNNDHDADGHDNFVYCARKHTRSRTSSETSTSLRSQLAEAQLALQLANSDNLSLTTELSVVRKQVSSLKEVIVCSKQMLQVREEQVEQLKGKLHEIEESLAERELKIMSDHLKQEYDRQLANIRNLRQLYEERTRVSAAERENLLRQISIKKDELAAEFEKTKNLEERISGIESELETSNKNLISTKIQRDEFNYENRELKEEMAVINKLFSQMLMGFNGTNNLDIDRLTIMLEENRSLLNEMATNETDPGAAGLPKLLFDIVKQANDDEVKEEINIENDKINNTEDEPMATSSNPKVASAQEIIGNLPKVWRVLMELLNHHKIEQVQFQENGQSEDCYKSVQTPTGPQAELSVSKTYIKLKDLILEKKALQKETTKLKTLNSHLERRLHEQEKRLSSVSLELTKTWHLVGKMQRQHRQLHTHEQILRYQLQQKRRLLTELKEELEYCRRKWAAARAKNDESQLQCDDMRREFAKRKLQDANNSAESGYSDGPISDEDDVAESPNRNYHAMFDQSRKIQRMQSESPNRWIQKDINPRGSSAPPVATFLTEVMQTTTEISPIVEPLHTIAASTVIVEDAKVTVTMPQPSCNRSAMVPSTSGTVPKQGLRLSRSKKREKVTKPGEESLEDMFFRLSGGPSEPSSDVLDSDEKRANRSDRIQKLEEQCKSLIAQVIETSNYREELNLQLSKFKKELSPTAVPLRAVITSESSLPQTEDEAGSSTEFNGNRSSLTTREEEYTSRRAERLRRLEEESKQLMSRIKRTTDRGKNMKTLLDQIHTKHSNSREGSVDEISSTDETDLDSSSVLETISQVPDISQNATVKVDNPNLVGAASTSSKVDSVRLTLEEEAYTARRSERLKRLEEESKQLISKLTRNSRRGTVMNSKLDQLHSKYGSEGDCESSDQETRNNSQPDHIESSPEQLIDKDEACAIKRAERLETLAEEGKQLIAELAQTCKHGEEVCSQMDQLEPQIMPKEEVVPSCSTENYKNESNTENDTTNTEIQSESEFNEDISRNEPNENPNEILPENNLSSVNENTENVHENTSDENS